MNVKENGTIGESLSRFGSDARDIGDSFGKVASKTIDKVSEVGGEAIRDLRTTSKTYLEDFESYVVSNPIRSICYGIAAGFLASRLMMRD